MNRTVANRRIGWKAMLLPALAGLAVLSAPVQAQLSAGFKFLEAVRKKDGAKVEEALSDPAQTIINTRDVTTGQTALHIVTARRDLTWMTYLVAKGANVNARDGKGMTPIQIATNFGFLEGVDLLVRKKADVDQPNDAGETPLITAVHRRDLGMLRALLKAGADPDRADNSGRSARDYAAFEGKGNALLATIESDAKPKAARAGAKPVYGPSF